jgi:hypothetical protein
MLCATLFGERLQGKQRPLPLRRMDHNWRDTSVGAFPMITLARAIAADVPTN